MSNLNFTKEEATKEIKAVKQSNKVAREIRAKKKGYNSSVEYLSALQSIVDGSKVSNSSKPAKVKKAGKTSSKPVIYVVDILDCSISMGHPQAVGCKLFNGIKGINKGIEKLSENQEVEYKYGLVLFSTPVDYTFKKPSNNFNLIDSSKVKTGGSTALYDAIGKTLTELMKTVEKDAKVLINIYTDGEENSSRNYSPSSIEKLIKKSEDRGFTITFVGTDRDVELIQRSIKIHESNTLKYDGSAKGLSQATMDTVTARDVYSTKVLKGEDVKTGFYKKFK